MMAGLSGLGRSCTDSSLLFAHSGGLGSMFVAGTVGWFVGAKLHCRRLAKKLNSKHKNEQKELYTQYYNDVYTLQTQNAELIMALEQMGVKTR
jgi:hypothetical protein